jgi:hypothetical protein
MSVRNGNSADATASTATLSDVSTNRVVTTTLEGLQIAEDGEILGGLVPPHLLSAGGEDLSMNGPVTCHDCGRSYSTVSHLKQVRF